MAEHGTEYGQILQRMLVRLRRRLWLRQGLYALAAGVLGYAVLTLVGMAPERSVFLALAVAGFSLLINARRTLRGVDIQALARHLDRRYPELEESTGLLLMTATDLAAMQGLQRDRVARRFQQETDDLAWLPRVRPAGPLAVLAMGALLALMVPGIHAWLTATPAANALESLDEAPSEASLAGVQVLISPPAYTGLADETMASMDLEMVAGSEVRWQLEFSHPDSRYALLWPDGRQIELEPSGPDGFQASARIEATSLYRIVELQGDSQRPMPDVFTLSVRLDREPRIRILEPQVTALEIPLGEPPRFESRALVSDDFGLGTVDMLASVGKGGGEGVKFRDQAVAFTHREETVEGVVFQHQWDLLELGMEPGDEVYFFVTARDNREPESNLARSRTVVVRWLDEAAPVAEFAGLAIDVMPDYFKSQRQIIIETEQLIADRDDLDKQTFDATSRGLAQAQSDLKLRYGQYLGDESEEGGPFEPPPAEADEGDHGEDEDRQDEPREALEDVGHDHAGEAATAADIDTTGSAAELIGRFAHDHGASEIGPITSRNPVGLMKRSLSNMWQAELHLHLSEPELALPFEVEALKYYNLARQADRIYTRRLGFEPPPVSEERRLSGELDEILEYSRREVAAPDPRDTLLYQAAWRLFSTRAGQALREDDRELLEELGGHLTTMSQQRPALIQHAATVERLLLAGRIELMDCPGCLAGLEDATWSLLQAPDASPTGGERRLDPDDALTRDWVEQVKQ
jgi:hypothetical protein